MRNNLDGLISHPMPQHEGPRITTAVTTADTTVTNIYGVGPVVAAIILGHTGDIARFPTAGHFARYNATAPIEASSGSRTRHRLNPRGNRQPNHALHMGASEHGCSPRRPPWADSEWIDSRIGRRFDN